MGKVDNCKDFFLKKYPAANGVDVTAPDQYTGAEVRRRWTRPARGGIRWSGWRIPPPPANALVRRRDQHFLLRDWARHDITN